MTVKTRELNERLLDQSRIALKAAGDKDIEIAGGASEEIRIVYESDDFSVSTSGSNSRLGLYGIEEAEADGYWTRKAAGREQEWVCNLRARLALQ